MNKLISFDASLMTASAHVLGAAAHSLGFTVLAAPVRDADEIEHAITPFASKPNGGLYLPPDVFTFDNRALIVELAARHRLRELQPVS